MHTVYVFVDVFVSDRLTRSYYFRPHIYYIRDTCFLCLSTLGPRFSFVFWSGLGGGVFVDWKLVGGLGVGVRWDAVDPLTHVACGGLLGWDLVSSIQPSH